MIRSFQNISHHEDILFDSGASFFNQMSNKLEQASKVLSFAEFHTLSILTIKKCLRKAEIDSSFSEALPYLRKWVKAYNSDLQIIARLLLLQSKLMTKSHPQQSLKKLNKVKHLIIDTDCEYLMPKAFVLESHIHDYCKDQQLRLKTLKKCIEYGENYLVEYLKQSHQTRLEFAENMIVAYFEMSKLVRDSKPNYSNECLSKAYQAALKNYGPDHFSTKIMSQVLNEQRNLIQNIARIPSKASTQILVRPMKKNVDLHVLYSWEDEAIIVRAVKNKADSIKILAAASAPVKLDMKKITILKNKDIHEWLEFAGSEITIHEDDLEKIIGGLEPEIKHTDSQTFKQLPKEQLFKADVGDISSSSEDDEDLLPVQGQGQDMFMKFFSREKSTVSRSKSRDSRRSRN